MASRTSTAARANIDPIADERRHPDAADAMDDHLLEEATPSVHSTPGSSSARGEQSAEEGGIQH
eukprot:CAMPEP_0117667874 /NCGR_PEP_ID=MMETSP0804-20121206/11217_1 /TAXON_ID=1074897 /ORGANISM="Tetraselmis astigmatica, Strain CCMP880" /LENGTH=63 /DNA_ID=CAMNT_0005475665 /DNA_START=663 /DNA_END=854 /DNA_ORIENTATION=-